MEYGERRNLSVSCPPSSYPTYPGGEPMNFATACFSMNSLMSKRISEDSERNMYFASVRATSVLPTPVGPRKRNAPIGRFGLLKPARERLIARAKAHIAGRWEQILLCSSDSILIR